MKKSLTTLTFLFSVILISCSQKSPGDENLYHKYEKDIFTLEIPNTWNQMEGSELAVFKEQYEQQSEELFKQYYNRAEGYEWGVPFISGFFAPEMEATLILLTMKIPEQSKDYLNQRFKDSKDIIDWGINQGQVKQAFSNELTEINDMPVLKTDLEMGNGSRMIGYTFYFLNQPDKAIQVVMLFDPGLYSKYKENHDHIISSLLITFPEN